MKTSFKKNYENIYNCINSFNSFKKQQIFLKILRKKMFANAINNFKNVAYYFLKKNSFIKIQLEGVSKLHCPFQRSSHRNEGQT